MSSESQVTITLPDGSQRAVGAGSTAADVAASIGPGLAKAAIAARIDGDLVDLAAPLVRDCRLEILTLKSPGAEEVYRHTMTHIMAQAAKRLFPGTALGVGPVIEDGFYYDLGTPRPLTDEDLEALSGEMKKIIEEDYPITREECAPAEAVTLMRERDEELKVDLILGSQDPVVSFYRMGEFVDMCRGPHLPRTGMVRDFRLLSVAGAYWKGDAENRQLSRVYGTAFPSKKELKAHLNLLEEAKKRDHRKIGTEMELFSFHPEGPGFPFFHPKGQTMYRVLTDYWREEHLRRGYVEVQTPLILDESLWHRSGHWDHYKENMYFVGIDEQGFAVKPMNCPGHCLIYSNRHHSYRELPIRMMEPGRVHRHEMSGVMHGLFRVRTFAIDDAHIYCMPEQIEDEILQVIDLILTTYKKFGFEDYAVELSTRPEKSIGSDEIWEKATAGLVNALKRSGLPYNVNPGDGAFYGPKIDFHIRDCLKRTWQCGTVQLDFSMPERFDLEYVGADNQRHRPVMVHRAAFGSFERFLGILIEHYGGRFPLWLAPVQARILTVTRDQNIYALGLKDRLVEAGLRVETDTRNEKIGYKVREAQLARCPLMIVIGAREAEEGHLTVRFLNGRNVPGLTFEEFLEEVVRKNLDVVPE